MNTRLHSSTTRRRLAAVIIVLALIAGIGTVIAPGWARLAVMQPARDVLFFSREIEPLENWNEIESANPEPDSTEVLRAQGESLNEPDLVLDVWIPDVVPAPAVLLLHGSSPRGRRLGFNMLLADYLRHAGWLVLTPDARGFGESDRPHNIRDPAAWSVTNDLARLVAYATTHPKANGTVTAVGHSMGANHLLELDEAATKLSAIALIGPARFLGDYSTAWWQRVRFSSDRRIAKALPGEVLRQVSRQGDPVRVAANAPAHLTNLPILLMDGEREGPELVAVLDEVAGLLGTNAHHVTIPGSHHYCSSYQLPWPFTTVYVRRDVFSACFSTLRDFLETSIDR